jgi:hypothetical protein
VLTTVRSTFSLVGALCSLERIFLSFGRVQGPGALDAGHLDRRYPNQPVAYATGIDQEGRCDVGVLLWLAGGVAFVAGIAVGMGVFSRVLVQRERQLMRERQAVNGAWRRLYRHTSVERRVWMSDFDDREHTTTR